jgi:RNA polymerase sigma-70 factor (ECF subfamily)
VNSDWQCFIEARQGDEKSWRLMMEKYQPRLSALVLLITGSSAAADDIVQETFIRAMAARINNRNGTVQGYLGTIAYRLAVKERNREQRNVEFSGLDLPELKENPLENILNNERDRLTASAIGELDNDHRDILLLRFYAGHSYEKIADLLNIPLGTVKSRIFYAVKTCRNKLKEKGVL